MYSPPLMTGPVALYNNLPIEPQYYVPSMFYITDIGIGVNTLVTTNVNHDYVVGQVVRLLIPNGYGSRKLNEQTGVVIAIPLPNQVLLDLDSIGTDPFINANRPTAAQIVAIGDVNSGRRPSVGYSPFAPTIDGAFINISPLGFYD